MRGCAIRRATPTAVGPTPADAGDVRVEAEKSVKRYSNPDILEADGECAGTPFLGTGKRTGL